MAGLGLSRLVGGGSDVYGTKPKVPDPIDYTKDLKEAIGTNKEIFPDLIEFSKLATDEMANLLERAMPGYKNIRDSGTSAINAMVRGELPSDVEDLIARKSAEQGIAGGYGGSEFGKHQFVRTLGLTSLDVIQRGLDSANKWIGQAQNMTYDFSRTFLLNKEDAMRRTEFNWQRDWLANQVAAAPDPSSRGEFDSEMGAIGMNLSAYAGGAGYAQTYKPSYSSPGSAGRQNNGSGFGVGNQQPAYPPYENHNPEYRDSSDYSDWY